jgi:type 1 fimbria pilin
MDNQGAAFVLTACSVVVHSRKKPGVNLIVVKLDRIDGAAVTGHE